MTHQPSNTDSQMPLNAPPELVALPRWVLHKQKVPNIFNPSAKRRSIHQVNVTKSGVSFLTFEDAVRGLELFKDKIDGIGFALDKSMLKAVVIDVDDSNHPHLSRIKSALADSYAELSPSGNGFHFWFLDDDIDGIGGRRIDGLEIYAAQRFLTFTGNKLEDHPLSLAKHNGLTRELLVEFLNNEQADSDIKEAIARTNFDAPVNIPDESLLNIIKNSNDVRLKRLLLEGKSENYKSPSEADWHCVLKLCFWTAGNAGQIERMIGNSPLGERTKWMEREDYRRRTIVRALDTWDHISFKGSAAADSNNSIIVSQGDKTLFATADGSPIHFRVPRGYSIVPGKGIFKINDDDDDSIKNICNDVILPLRTFKNADTQAVATDLWYQRRGAWDHTVFENDILATMQNITKLSAIGLDMTSDNARAMVRFFRAFKAANSDLIEEVVAYSQTGWQHNGKFIYPIETGEYIIDVGRDINLLPMFKPTGDRDNWIALYNYIKQYPYPRLAVAAALAAPTVKLLALRNMTIEFWSKSGEGKTAILKLAESTYKNPNPPLKFGATNSYFEARCIALCDFPLCVDELRAADRDKRAKASLNVFAHLIESGASKGRATKEVNQCVIKTFRTIAIITGENPLTDFNTDMGIKRRILELHCREIFPHDVMWHGQSIAAFLHTFTAENYALVGQDWIDTLEDSNVQHELIAKYHEFQQKIISDKPDTFVDHCNLLAACAAADFIFNKHIADPDSTPDSERILSIERQLNNQDDEKDSHRAFEFIIDWIAQNKRAFINIDNPPEIDPPAIYGWIIGADTPYAAYAILPSVLRQALEHVGFNSNKVLTELAIDNIIVSQTSQQRKTFTVVQRIKDFGLKRVIKIWQASIEKVPEGSSSI